MIDDEAAEYGIKVVKTDDRLMAKKYGYRKPPGITYFRKGIADLSACSTIYISNVTTILSGKYINYDGDIDDEEEVLDWLTLPDNMEMTDHIEQVNRKMFQKIRQTSDYLAVFMCKVFCVI